MMKLKDRALAIVERMELPQKTGETLIGAVLGAGYSVVLLGRALGHMSPHQIRKRWRDILQQMYVCGVESLPVTLVVAAFVGFLLALSTGIELAKYGQQQAIGQLLAIVMCREFGPFMTALICAANV